MTQFVGASDQITKEMVDLIKVKEIATGKQICIKAHRFDSTIHEKIEGVTNAAELKRKALQS